MSVRFNKAYTITENIKREFHEVMMCEFSPLHSVCPSLCT